MLILTRRIGESIDITCPDGTRITILQLGVDGGQVRYGFTAPYNVVIDRHEVTVRKKREAQTRDENGDMDGNRIEPESIEDPGPEGDAGPIPEPPPSASSRTLKLAASYRPRVANPDSLDHRRKLEGLR